MLDERKIGVIDMGTNTFHLMITAMHGGKLEILYREKVAVRLGKGGISKGFITPEAWERALRTILHFKGVLTRYETSEVHATATSAIRNAKNGKALAEDIEKKTQIPVRIISGDQEAELIYFGVKRALPLGKGTSLIMDIGGGSVEFIIGNEEEIFWKRSFEVGGQRLLDQFHQHDPILANEIDRLKDYLSAELEGLVSAAEQYTPSTFIGSSGTFDTLSDIYLEKSGKQRKEGVTEFPLPKEAYLEIHQEITRKSRSQRLQIPGMLEMRVDMIVVASCLIYWVFDHLPSLKHLRVSAYALKEGILYSQVKGAMKRA